MEKYLLVRVRFDARVASVEPLGLEYVSAVLGLEHQERHFFDEILYSRLFRKRRLLRRIEALGITAVCFTVMSDKAQYVLDMIAAIKRAKPEMKIIVGGPEVNINHRDFMREGIDFVYYDHGLESLQYAVSVCFDAEKLGQASGLAYRKDGKWQDNPPSGPVSGYHVRPDRSLYYQNGRKYRIIAKGSFSTMKTSFSCPQNCSFCISRQFNGGVYAERSVDDVVAEIEGIDNDRIWLVDDDFLVSRKRVTELCNQLIARNCVKTFMVFARADSVVKCADLLPLLYRAGFRDMLVGLEAVEDKFLEQYNKNASVQVNRQAVTLLRENHMLCNGLFVVSDRFTRKNFSGINRFIRENKLVWVLFSILIPFKGTRLYEESRDRLYKYQYRRTDGTHILLKPEAMPHLLYYISFHMLYYLNYPRLYLAALLRRYEAYVNRGFEP